MVSDKKMDKERQCCFMWYYLILRHTVLSTIISMCLAALMSTVYEEQKDEDGFLYVQYSGESTFG
jgi:hypothetical protein